MNGTEGAEYYEERSTRTFREFLEIPFRYWRPGIIAFGVLLTIGLVLAVVAPKKYRSSTLIIVESKSVPPEYYVTSASAEALAQRLNTLRIVVLSRTRLEEVVKKVNPYPEMAGEPLHVVVEAMRGAIEIRVYGQDSFLFGYVNRDPRKAMEVTAMLAAQFIADADSLRERLSNRAFDLLQANLLGARKALEEREQVLRNYEQKNWDSLPDHLESNLHLVQQLQLEQQTLAENQRVVEERRSSLEHLLETRHLPVMSNPQSGAMAELAKLRANYESQRARYTDEHPDMRMLRARIDNLSRQVAAQQQPGARPEAPNDPEGASLTQSLRLAEEDIESLKTRRVHLDERITLLQSRIEKTPKAKQELAGLTRDYKELREDYDSALKREKDAAMARRLEEYWKSGYFRILDPAYLPGRPIYPYALFFALGGLVLGLGAGLVAAGVADLLDHSVKSARELTEALPYPVLVTIPRAASPRIGGRTATADQRG